MAKAKGSGDNSNILAIAAQLQQSTEAAVIKSGSQDAAVVRPSQSDRLRYSTAAAAAKLYMSSTVFKNKQTSGSVLVSVVIPVFNKVSYTLDCLDKLSRQASKYSVEVVVVDNASSDQTPQLIAAIPGIKYVRNQENLGFVDGCNVGVKHSAGSVVILLNNDTAVQGGWLDALVDRLLSDPSIGLVGSKIIYPDGRLQEAGGIIFSNGSGHNYGKNQKPDDFEYNYFRDVDYCSGASLAFRRADFDKLGGFDQRFAPAYYEDCDLAMGIRYKLGKRVVYEPLSTLFHIEGGTAGTDSSSGFKRYQTINQKKFVEKWSRQLAKNHFPASTDPLVASRYGKKKQLLIVDSIVPQSNRDAGSLRMSQIISSAIQLGYNVTLFADNRVASQPYTRQFQDIGVEVVYGSGVSYHNFYQRRLNLYDAVLLSRPTTAIWHLAYCQAFQQQAHLIYDTVDLHFLRIRRQAAVDKDAKLMAEAEKWQELEYYLMDRTDTTLVVSYEEKKLLEQARKGLDVRVLSVINPSPNTKASLSFADRQGLLFMGDYSRAPNYSAASWFVKSVLPIVLKELPNVSLKLVGSNPEAVQNLAGPNVEVVGFVEDKDPCYNQARIFVCPLLYGAGVKGKISESIAYGLPVVTTSIGTEGMHLQNGLSCIEAETPDSFARGIIKLYTDEALWEKVRKNAYSVFDKYFSEKAGLEAAKTALTK